VLQGRVARRLVLKLRQELVFKGGHRCRGRAERQLDRLRFRRGLGGRRDSNDQKRNAHQVEGKPQSVALGAMLSRPLMSWTIQSVWSGRESMSPHATFRPLIDPK